MTSLEDEEGMDAGFEKGYGLSHVLWMGIVRQGQAQMHHPIPFYPLRCVCVCALCLSITYSQVSSPRQTVRCKVG